MSDEDDVTRVQALYPQIYFACHVRHEHRRTSEDGISARDAALLGHLDEERPTSPAALARHLGVRASTLSAALAHLEGLGYVSRSKHAEDARRHELRLTARGTAARRAGSVLDAERVRDVLARLDDGDRARAVHGLELLARAAREARDEHAGAVS